MSGWAAVVRVLEDGVTEGIYPGAVAAVAVDGELVFHEAVGLRSVVPTAAANTLRTRYDLASLTKPVVATLVARHRARHGLDLDAAPRGPTWKHLLGHASGWPAHRDYSALPADQIPTAVWTEPLERPGGLRAVYSDLGYMALGWSLEDLTGRRLDELVDAVRDELRLGELAFGPSEEAAPTERCARRGLLVGAVHDPNAWALGGVAGHAGLFGTAADVAAFGARLLHAVERETALGKELACFWGTPAASEPTTWRLGFDTPSLVGSSAGTRFGPRAVGHLGFTGTSLWLDPDARLSVALLSNRVHPEVVANPAIRLLRPRFHDAVREALTGT